MPRLAKLDFGHFRIGIDVGHVSKRFQSVFSTSLQPAQQDWQISTPCSSGVDSTKLEQLVQFQYGASPFSTLGVQWDTVDSSPSLQASLEEFCEVLRGLSVEVNESGQVTSTPKGEHELMYEPIEGVAGDYTYPGFLGAWYCDETGQVYILYYANILELAEQIDPLAEFRGYRAGFTT